MQTPTAQTIARYLHDLAFTHNHERLKREFMDDKHTQEDAFISADYDLNGAYIKWHQDRDAVAASNHLENARAICEERLYHDYLQKYNACVSYFEGMLSRSGTPVHQDAHMQNLILRVTACLQ